MLQLDLVDAAGSAALQRAAAALRVLSFHRSGDGAVLYGPIAEQAERAWAVAHMRSEEGRAERLHELGMRVSTLAAVAPPMPQPSAEPLVLDRRVLWHWAADSLLVGTLDLHVGDRLPGEPLEGMFPASALPSEEATLASLLSIPVDAASLGSRASYTNLAGSPNRSAQSQPVSSPLRRTPYTPPSREPPSPLLAAQAAACAAAAAARASTHESAGRRAYLFNVCVAAEARRRGVASRMLAEASCLARDAGVEMLYVHVEAINAAARALYAAEGFTQESEEPEWLALLLRRPQRLLLAKRL